MLNPCAAKTMLTIIYMLTIITFIRSIFSRQDKGRFHTRKSNSLERKSNLGRRIPIIDRSLLTHSCERRIFIIQSLQHDRTENIILPILYVVRETSFCSDIIYIFSGRSMDKLLKFLLKCQATCSIFQNFFRHDFILLWGILCIEDTISRSLEIYTS